MALNLSLVKRLRLYISIWEIEFFSHNEHSLLTENLINFHKKNTQKIEIMCIISLQIKKSINAF